MLRRWLTFAAVMLTFGVLGGQYLDSQAQARPGYLKVYAGVSDAKKAEAKEKKCGLCHPEKDKKVRNKYGMAMGKALPMKNTKEKEKITAAIEAADKATATEE